MTDGGPLDIVLEAMARAQRSLLSEASKSAGVPLNELEILTYVPAGRSPLWEVRVRATGAVLGSWEYGFLDPLTPATFRVRPAQG